MEQHYKIIGIFLIVLAFVHTIFPKYFNWKQDLKNVSLVNRQMVYIHTLFIGIALFLMGILCFTSAEELTQAPLGKKIALGFGIFWLIRLLVQFFGYSPSLWRGKKFETTVHLMFIVLWFYFTVVFLGTYFS
jgi:hypothetical protein